MINEKDVYLYIDQRLMSIDDEISRLNGVKDIIDVKDCVNRYLDIQAELLIVKSAVADLTTSD